jgi:hypothetical protein
VTGKTGTLMERFERWYIPEPNSGCWIWLGALTPKGYGWFYYPPRNMVRAHVCSYEMHHGDRRGLYVLHSCDVRCCVNPDHLRLGTQLENMQDRDDRHRRAPPKGILNGRANISEEVVRAIRADERAPRFIAQSYPDIPYSTIQKIRLRATWKHL